MNTARKHQLLNIFAASKGSQLSRKELEKTLAKYRKQFDDARSLYSATNSQLQELQQVSDKARQDMASAKDGMGGIYDNLQTMDLTGATGIRDRKDLKTYVVDGKEYHVDKGDDDIKLTPWKDYRKSKKQEEEEECLDCSDVDDIADAVDVFAEMCDE